MDEHIKNLILKLRRFGWSVGQSGSGYFLYNKTTRVSFSLMKHRYIAGKISKIDLTKFNIDSNPVIVNNIQMIFEDPFNVTGEEAEMFKLCYGFDYPEELVSKL